MKNTEKKSRLDIARVRANLRLAKLPLAAIPNALSLAIISAVLLIVARPGQAQNEHVLYNFCSEPNCTDGGDPSGSLISDGDSNFYGTTFGGGTFGYGTVYELSPNGSGGWNETVIYNFTGGIDGSRPSQAGVIFDSTGNLYGTASMGGANGLGVVFELSPAEGGGWKETVLYNFGGGGEYPENGLIMDSTGNLYGSDNAQGAFELSPSGGGWVEQAIYDFNTDYYYAGLTMNAAGSIFGAAYDPDNVFEISSNGDGGWTPSVIHIFTGAPKDGNAPEGTPVLDKAGNVYGTTTTGGAKNYGAVYKLTLVTTGEKKGTWTEKILYSFKGGTEDGTSPWGGVVLDSSGNIYGTTSVGGKYGDGTVFELVADGSSYKEKILWNFNGVDGANPFASLTLDSGNIYGNTSAGGSGGNGVIFEVNPSGKAAPTTTALTSSLNPSISGEAVTFTAVVTPAPFDGETITFKHGATVLGTGLLSGGSASFTTSTLNVGTTTVDAVYGGDGDSDASTSNIVKQVVEK